MTDTADLNLVLGAVRPDDALHARAADRARGTPLTVPFSVGIELLFVAKRFKLGHREAIAATEALFEVERREVLYTAADALDEGDVKTVFDAVHLADALHRGGALHTADAELLATEFPTRGF